MNLKPAELAFWNEYVESAHNHLELRDAFVMAGQAGDAEIADILLALYLCGKKSAGSSLLEGFNATGDQLPQVGHHWILLNSRDEPGCILKVVRVALNKFKDVPIEIAVAEGEGDLSLNYWMKEHARFFKPYLAELGITDLNEAIVVTEFFELVYRGRVQVNR